MTDTPWYLKNYKEAMHSRGRILPVVETHLVRKAVMNAGERDIAFLHPSQICKRDWCPRSSWYLITTQERPDSPLNFRTLNIFEEGHNIHGKWQKWMSEAGLLEGMWHCYSCNNDWWEAQTLGQPFSCPACAGERVVYREVPISDNTHHILGHADGIINDRKGKAVLEIKSVGAGTIRIEAPELYARYTSRELTFDQMWKEIKKPFFTHLRQVNLYMYALGIHDAVVLYESKANQDVKEFNIKYNESLVSAILAGCSTVKEALKSNMPPMRPMTASLDSRMCKDCSFYNRCWSIDEDKQNTDNVVSLGDRISSNIRVTRQAVRRHPSNPSAS